MVIVELRIAGPVSGFFSCNRPVSPYHAPSAKSGIGSQHGKCGSLQEAAFLDDGTCRMCLADWLVCATILQQLKLWVYHPGTMGCQCSQ